MIHRFAEIGSTNDECLRLAASGAPAGTVVVADRQSAGRGRRGRPWSSPPGTGLYVSLLVRLPSATDTSPTTLLPLLAGVAAARAIATVLRAAGNGGAPVRLKWPNDVLLNGHKLAGILVEGSFGPDGFAAAVGLGVNVSTRPQDLPPRVLYPATSILAETDRAVDRESLLQAWLAEMDAALALWQCPDAAARLVDAWNALDANAGRVVRIALAADENGSEAVEGVDVGLAPNGALRLRLDSGEIREILAGDCLP